MASNIKATPQKEEVPEKEGPETAPGNALLDLSETEEASEEGEEAREEPEEEAESESGELVEVQQKVPAKSEAKEPTERTDDPVRMYLREMGSVELLSREGEIAIAKRIRGRPRSDDRGPVREPAHLPGHHHLA
jgi:DNA-directed RNA polymerase sigma subunit (sigma70/sigma32)